MKEERVCFKCGKRLKESDDFIYLCGKFLCLDCFKEGD